MKQFIFIVVMALGLAGCSPSTQIVKSWKDPNSTLEKTESTKIFVLAMIKDEASRRVIEDELVKRMAPYAFASYNFITSDMLKEASAEKLTEKLKLEKYTHALFMRLADIEKETSYVPGTTSYGYYGGYGRYYGYGASMYSTPGYYSTSKNYFVETTVYSVDQDKLLWTGTTKTVDPSKIDKAVNDIATVVAEKMRKDGFIK
ncbi:hypothetical protein [Solitalea canadensis]|uniref:DUF4136 domain-containing protein n=1 Tax=Solitalea canadensis (strain ATCC 29591 / DSM 3403 / JCM 21819 / LMG 8368 / NBRC 15130 / NCIMB 12057 / USAM 9D) TaxID=929556 RepID=H8KVV5_SOLCM|nr:hypothetical protein [Solitalea canadensis]AFD06858.1 hypothetical protein Solca_1796 [Solitalea canadensis DSM 3403]